MRLRLLLSKRWRRLKSQRRKKIMNSTVAEPKTVDFQQLTNLQSKCLEEVPLYFRKGAMDIDPKRGLAIHGPVDAGEDIQTIRIGIISDAKGIEDMTQFLEYINNKSVRSVGESPFITLTFPGFQKAFRSRLILSPDFNEKILTQEVENAIENENPNVRIRKAVELYGKKLSKISDKVVRPDVIVCHKIEKIEAFCKESQHYTLTKAEREKAEEMRKKVQIHKILAPLDEDTKNFIDMVVRVDFRRLLKAESINVSIPIQIFKQSTLEAINEVLKIPTIPRVKHRKEDPSTIAWNLAVALYYKANHFPWRVGRLSPGSCYIGISFYYDQTTYEKNMFASLAQVFTDTGEGLVVRGDNFQWDAEKKGQPYLTRNGAAELLRRALGLYKKHHDDQYPNRVVIHKSSKYSGEEVQGFNTASQEVPKRDYITVSTGYDVFFYRNGDNPVLRGTYLRMSDGSTIVFTGGYVPYLRCYQGPRVPKPLGLFQQIGDTPSEEAAIEMLALTRLDWNTARYNSHLPITLRFAEKVGKILGSIPQKEEIEHQYRFYM
jgi:hypothetical protein